MVNTGKPSGACDVCKKRKIKCDETRPFCLRCEKAGRECTGVPDPQVLTFRNRYSKESSLRRQTSEGDAGPPHLSCSCADCILFQTRSDERGLSEGSAPPAELEYPIECQAIALFMNDYQSESLLPSDSRLMVKPLLFTRIVYINAPTYEAIHPATAAPAIGLFAKYNQRPDLRAWPMRKYGQAIRILQQALQDPGGALSDGTLQAILVLKLFESALATTHDLSAYYTHNEGIKAVIKRRGQQNFASPLSLQLFRAFRTHLVVTTFENAEATEPLDYVDSSFDWFADRDLPDETEINTQLVKIGYELSWVRFRAEMAMASEDIALEQEAVLTNLLSELRDLDTRLDQWFDELPEYWWPTTVTVSASCPDVWSGVINTFPERILAGMLCIAYVKRLVIHEKIIQLATCLGQSHPTESTYAMRATTDAFCAVVPWLFGCDALGDNNPAKNKTMIDPLAWLRAGVTVCMKWIPIFANSEGVASEEQRRWLRGRLDFAAQEANFAQARILAERVRV